MVDVLQHMKNQRFAVIVIAEGAGEKLLGESTKTGASGNKKFPMIGEFMREKKWITFATMARLPRSSK